MKQTFSIHRIGAAILALSILLSAADLQAKPRPGARPKPAKATATQQQNKAKAKAHLAAQRAAAQRQHLVYEQRQKKLLAKRARDAKAKAPVELEPRESFPSF